MAVAADIISSPDDFIAQYRGDGSIHPLLLFAQWYKQALAHPHILEANAVNLATASSDGYPHNRMVLLKSVDKRGFTFYSNAGSRKGRDLADNPRAAMCLYWEAIGKQVRIVGPVTTVSDDEADAYFHSRPLGSRIGAWASKQSQPLDHRDTLHRRIAEYTQRFDNEPPRPPFWQGFCLQPTQIEFWQQGENRLHHRHCFDRTTNGLWHETLLYP